MSLRRLVRDGTQLEEAVRPTERDFVILDSLRCGLVVQLSVQVPAAASDRWGLRLGNFLPPSPPGEESAARKHKTWQTSAGDGSGDTSRLPVEGIDSLRANIGKAAVCVLSCGIDGSTYRNRAYIGCEAIAIERVKDQSSGAGWQTGGGSASSRVTICIDPSQPVAYCPVCIKDVDVSGKSVSRQRKYKHVARRERTLKARGGILLDGADASSTGASNNAEGAVP
jgi:hypothetical protein